MEYGGWLGIELPEEDPILDDIRQEPVSDSTEIHGTAWSELKSKYWSDAYWNREYYTSLTEEDK